ncbi:Ctr copper transporter family-domain-containing protein [Echria macrotheca]|uniref:Copper transport protein n=1 Tax=Echria macrotheca TaxID=438768 RepID=A0AAJ0BHE3_9PEZI|nr:Ctr copper transporter family-domain-containing protein [Echria macrotheca]
MDHSMTMASETTMAMPAATSGASMDDMGSGMGDGCKISMLWNWDTIDTCFVSSTWHVRSAGMFAGSCIGVILLVMLLELLRRTVKEYDRYLVRKNNEGPTVVADHRSADSKTAGAEEPLTCGPPKTYRPAVMEQAIRALLHTCQFAVAYFVMLLAMYYNGYIIICIFIGAYIGSFVFQWEPLTRASRTSAANEATVCCG